ncbi:MAG: hypothetical protein CMB80_28425 [Flammeovirgaceae bacterium]|nr:hypothetical protein [Flammeovirgaceae bacterium]HCX21678.1 hypothetical protein [Cytophagales bacterium]|tara:strand:- start:1552 stop:3039 length:1488 start_codon:yes stop_codon:yes gene_type:complete
MSKEITLLSATDLARRIRKKELKITEVIEAFLKHIDEINPSVNAISQLRTKEDLRQEAKEKEAYLEKGLEPGPLFGVPVTVKESIMVKGLQLTNGDPMLKNNVAEEDALLVKRLKDAGAIIIGMTNLAFLSIDWQSTNAWNGTTNNPYDLSRTAGGSSGGSSAAVAAFMSPISIGADAGGSIRVPAHFCGIYGLRPTENYISNRGHLKVPGRPQGRRHIVIPGPFTNNLEDMRLAMKVLSDQTSQHISELPDVDFESSQWNQEPLNIAYSDSMNNVEIDTEYRSIFNAFIDSLKSEKMTLVQDHPIYDEKKAYLTANKVQGFENGINFPNIPLLNWLLYLFIRLKYNDHLWALGMAKGVRLSSAAYAKAIDAKDEFSDNYHAFLSKYDVWITPVCAIEAFEHQKAGKPFVINGKKVPYTKAIASYTFTSALSGHPILVIPIGKKKNGLPVGVQIHSRKWTDNRLIQIAQHLEEIVNKKYLDAVNQDVAFHQVNMH